MNSLQSIEKFSRTNSYASQQGFLGGFPNFFTAIYNHILVGGTLLIPRDKAIWMDILASELDNPPQTDIGARFRSLAVYATKKGFVGGFPTFNTEYKTKYEIKKGFVGGFPTFHIAYGAILFNSEQAEWKDISLAELGLEPEHLGDEGARFRATAQWASQHGYSAGFPNFFHADYGNGIVCGTILLKKDVAVWRDVSFVDLGIYKTRLEPNQELKINEMLTSADGAFKLILQEDGNLVLYRNSDGKAFWATNTVGKESTRAILQQDGNFVLYTADNKPLWNSVTPGHPDVKEITLQTDGNLVIYTNLATAIWDTGTTLEYQKRVDEAPQMIQGKYISLGLNRSELGLASSNFQIENNQFTQHFRGGKIELTNASGAIPIAKIEHQMEIWLRGVECQVRQESEDEISGTISVIVPGAGGQTNTINLTEANGSWQFGPDGMRIVLPNMLIHRGPPMNVTVVVYLVERDSGDISKFQNAVASKIIDTGKIFAAMEGIDAEAVAATPGGNFLNEISRELVKFITDSLLGMGDDLYNPSSFQVNWDEVISNRIPIQPPVTRPDDPRTISGWTHKVIVSGVDDGGDLGIYALYFEVRHEIISITK